jgi:hypothetical protein
MRIRKSFRVHPGRDPEKELRKIQHRFRAIEDRADRREKTRHLSHRISVSTMGAFAMLMLYLGVASSNGWAPSVALKHLAAFPNCNAARIVGLAPAYKGDPGYWSSHDRDKTA